MAVARRRDCTTLSVLLADGMVGPSQAREHINALWAKRFIKTMLKVSSRHMKSEGDSKL